MSVRLEEDRIVLEGVCRVEDAEPLAGYLDGQAQRPVDLALCEGMHGAILQALLAFRPRIVGLHGNPHLDSWLARLLALGNPGSVADPQDKSQNDAYNNSFATRGEGRAEQ